MQDKGEAADWIRALHRAIPAAVARASFPPTAMRSCELSTSVSEISKSEIVTDATNSWRAIAEWVWSSLGLREAWTWGVNDGPVFSLPLGDSRTVLYAVTTDHRQTSVFDQLRELCGVEFLNVERIGWAPTAGEARGERQAIGSGKHRNT